MVKKIQELFGRAKGKMPVDLRRFLVVGVLSTVLNYAVFVFLYLVTSTYYVAASAAGYVAGLILGYFLNRSWAFSSVIKKQAVEFLAYAGVYIASLLVSVLALRIAVEGAGFSPMFGNIFALIVSTALNFFCLKFIVFRPSTLGRFAKIRPYLTPAFWVALAIKAVSSFLFASHFVTQGFLPFINYFAANFRNPYDYFSALGLTVFPYPAGMLFLASLPLAIAKTVLSASIFSNLNLQLFLLRLPVLFFDVLIYLILCFLLPFKEKKVFWLYFASPILFYINYFHGQLDVIPTALLLLSIVFLFRGREALSFVLLGLGIATKTHLAVALPFYLVYLYRHHTSIKKMAVLGATSAVAFFAVNPYLLSRGFLYAVFNNPEQQRLFNLFIPFGFNNLQFFLAPAAIIFLFYKFASYQRLNRDSLLLMLGLTYTILIALVPPMQGWFYWSLPFLVFFLIKFKDPPMLAFWAMNALYILYFIFTRGSDIFEGLTPAFSRFIGANPPFALLALHGVNAVTVENTLFTLLEVSLAATAWWAYTVGISSNRLYQLAEKPFFLGIAGDSGVGKSTLSNVFEKVVGSRNFLRVDGDDIHKWERGHENWNAFTHLNPKSNNVHIDLEAALRLLKGESIERRAYDHRTGTFTEPITREAKRHIVFQGLMPFVLERMRDLFHHKIYVEADEQIRTRWKTKRDGEERNYHEAEILKEMERRKPDSERFIHPQKNFADISIRYTADPLTGGMSMEYTAKNSIFMDDLVSILASVPTLRVEHEYLDVNSQKVVFSGTISKEDVERIAYVLSPNLIDVLEGYPEFESDYSGVNQLLFINLLSWFYTLQGDAHA